MNEDQPRKPAGQSDGGQFVGKNNSEPEQPLTHPIADVDLDVRRSRALLLNVLRGLEGQDESLVLLGGHAVIERTQQLEAFAPAESTKDGDVGVLPYLLVDEPNLATVMEELGFVRDNPDRPGIWVLEAQAHLDKKLRPTLDLIAPEAFAGGKARRTAAVGVHGKTVTRAEGLELVVLDRTRIPVRSFDGSAPVNAYVAGTASLVAAKAFKLGDRTVQLATRPDRLRGKDISDLWRLANVSTIEEVRSVFDEALERPELAPIAHSAVSRLQYVFAEDIGKVRERYNDEKSFSVSQTEWDRRWEYTRDWVLEFTGGWTHLEEYAFPPPPPEPDA